MLTSLAGYDIIYLVRQTNNKQMEEYDMKIHYKGIQHERVEDAPFVGALIIAPTCNIKCKGCFNRDLKKAGTFEATAQEIIAEVKANPFNEGVIFGGLEWSESPNELVELCKVASDKGLKIMIYTGCEIEQFHARIGKACADKVGIPKDLKEDGTSLIWSYIGSQVLDFYITEDYYIKAGKYDATKLATERVHFGIILASDNQNVYKIERVQE